MVFNNLLNFLIIQKFEPKCNILKNKRFSKLKLAQLQTNGWLSELFSIGCYNPTN